MFRTSAFRLKSIIDDIDLKGGGKKTIAIRGENWARPCLSKGVSEVGDAAQ